MTRARGHSFDAAFSGSAARPPHVAKAAMENVESSQAGGPRPQWFIAGSGLATAGCVDPSSLRVRFAWARSEEEALVAGCREGGASKRARFAFSLDRMREFKAIALAARDDPAPRESWVVTDPWPLAPWIVVSCPVGAHAQIAEAVIASKLSDIEAAFATRGRLLLVALPLSAIELLLGVLERQSAATFR
jgi:hypothetical protein